MLAENFTSVLSNYLYDKEAYDTDKSRAKASNELLPSHSSYNSFRIVKTDIPQELQKIVQQPLYIKGSCGMAEIADVPWIGFFDKAITNGAQKGYYVVYLFRADMTGFYLSLNQGWTYFKDTYGTKLGREKINATAKLALQFVKKPDGFDNNEIQLGDGHLAKGYEQGNIISKFYPFESDTLLTDETALRTDLTNLIETYNKLIAIAGNSLLNLDDTFNEEEQYQNEIQTSVGKVDEKPDEPEDKKDAIVSPKGKRYPRNILKAAKALSKANYKCEVDGSHFTFMTKHGHQYVEAHHLIPIEFQDDFKYSIDITHNIVSLCPNCHRQIHHSTERDKQRLITQLFEQRELLLRRKGIAISIKELLTMYKLKVVSFI